MRKDSRTGCVTARRDGNDFNANALGPAQREQIVRAWRSERAWNRELRGQIGRMQRARGVLGRHDDVRKTVLELTMSLVDAEKGLCCLTMRRLRPARGRLLLRVRERSPEQRDRSAFRKRGDRTRRHHP